MIGGRGPVRGAAVLMLALLLACAGLAGGSRVAEAHASLVRSSPSSQAKLSEGPGSVDLWFSEPLEPQFSTFEVLGADGRARPVAGIRVDPADPAHLSGLPERLGPGLYTVAYRSLSTQDGHEWTGTFPFTVLNPDGSVPSGAAFAPEQGGGQTSPERVMGRWLGFTGWSLVLGAALLWGIVKRSPRPDTIVRRSTDRVASGLMLAALPLLVTGAALELVAQIRALDASALTVLSGTRFGTIWLWRQLAVLALALCVMLAILAATRRRTRTLTAARGAAVIVALWGLTTLSLISHAAAAPGFGWAVVVDFLHLVIAATWVGGLGAIAALLIRLRIEVSGQQRVSTRTAVILGVVAPFSLLAAAAVLVLSVTGILRSLGEVPTLGALLATTYGRWLLIKIALIVPLLGVAWLNRQALQRAARGGRRAEIAAARRLTRMLPVEALLGFGVLAIVAVLGQVPTARGTEVPQSPSRTQNYTSIQTAGDLTMHLQVSPASVGLNELRVHVIPTAGGSVSGLQGVFFTFAAAGRLGGERIEATSNGGGLYTAAGDFLSVVDTWNVRIDVRRAEGDVTSSFAVPISPKETMARRAWSSPAPQLTLLMLLGVVMVATGTAAVIGGRLLGRRSEGRVVVAGGLVVFVGLWFTASGGTPSGVVGGNPVPVTPESIALGSTLYATNCASCHGTGGRGDGPLAATLRPPPADLVTHVPLHPAADAYAFIANGFPASSMPAWKDKLTPEEIWHLVNFLRDGLPR